MGVRRQFVGNGMGLNEYHFEQIGDESEVRLARQIAQFEHHLGDVNGGLPLAFGINLSGILRSFASQIRICCHKLSR